MTKSICHKLFVVAFSILLAFSVSTVGANASFTPYCAQRTGTIERPVKINGKVYPAGTPLYGAHDGSRVGKNTMISAYIGKPNKNDGMIPKWALKRPRVNKQWPKLKKINKKKVINKPKVTNHQHHKIVRHKIAREPNNNKQKQIEANKNKSLHDAIFAGISTAIVLVVLYIIKRIA